MNKFIIFTTTRNVEMALNKDTITTLVYNQVEKHTTIYTTDGSGVTKSPMGMFEDEEIENDLKLVIEKVDAYYNYEWERKRPRVV